MENRTAARLSILTGLLHYHERMMLGGVKKEGADGKWEDVPIGMLYDGYADALREAIRCVKVVNGLK